jgi:hypothetical protein
MRYILITVILISLIFTSCEDPVPFEYDPQNYVEGALVVGEPIDNIIVMRSQPIQESFNYENSLIRDAEVTIAFDDREINLQIDDTGESGYYYAEDYLVEEGKEYNLTVRFADGTTVTGNTVTPSAPIWIKPPQETIQYPKDTINKDTRDTIIWDGEPLNGFWGISVKTLDTLEYGLHLDDVPFEEKNRRVFRRNEDNPQSQWRYKELATWGIIPSNQTPVIWNLFRWYGIHEITISNMDFNYLRWVLQRLSASEYNELLGSVEGNGIGVFGSLNSVKDTFFLIKNQP